MRQVCPYIHVVKKSNLRAVDNRAKDNGAGKWGKCIKSFTICKRQENVK